MAQFNEKNYIITRYKHQKSPSARSRNMGEKDDISGNNRYAGEGVQRHLPMGEKCEKRCRYPQYEPEECIELAIKAQKKFQM